MGKFYKSIYPLVKLYWLVFKPSVAGAACVFSNLSKNKVLLIKNTYRHDWTLCGGGVMKNETPDVTIKREIYEELGIEISQPTWMTQFISTDEHKVDTIDVYWAKIDENTPIIIEKSEIQEYGWFNTDSLPADISKYAKKAVDLFDKKIKSDLQGQPQQ